MPFFSIIIPTFNSAATLDKCLKSIFFQTFANFEILIIDGISSDNTLKIAEGFNDKRIIITSEPDNGIYDAMNKGIKLAKGEWLYFLGSDDDLYSNNILKCIYDLSLINNTHVIYGNVLSERFNGKYAGQFDFYKLYNQNICHQAIFFNYKIFKKIGIFNLKYKSHADYDHNIRWFLNKKILKTYTELIIANYADGGFSSLNNDLIFDYDKDFRFLISGYRTLPKSFLLMLSKKDHENKKQSRIFGIVNLILRVRYFLINSIRLKINYKKYI